ncbi:MAG: helix-turn-helix domain-containing protein [Defluviitaleaceae bacterium]|nr:helix-turn-helix domain-containing protein [Defluviitaleaceae bacterium]
MSNQHKFVFDKDLIKSRIRELRKLRNLTQEQAAELIDLKDSNSWAKVESYKSSLSLSFDNLIRIVNMFDVDVNYFFRSLDVAEIETSHTETLIYATVKDFTEKEKQLALSLIAAIRANREISI